MNIARKFLIIMAVVFLLASSASAENIEEFVGKWNFYSKYYPSVIISSENATVTDTSMVFASGDYKMAFNFVGDHYTSIGIYTKDFESFVGSCATMASIVVNDAQNFSNFLGYLVRMAFDAKCGETVVPFIYGNYTYSVSYMSDGYMLTFAEI